MLNTSGRLDTQAILQRVGTLVLMGAVSAVLMLSCAKAFAAKDAESEEIERKVNALLRKMTIEQKAGQVNQSGFGPYEKYMTSDHGLGHVVLQQGGGITAEQAAIRANELQKLAKEKAPLGIPVMIGADGIYDARVADSTTFPQEIGMGSTWNPELIQKAYSVISKEMRASGYGRTYSPNLGLCRDPRFGRTGECYTEDTYLASQLAVAAVKGLQGDSLKTGIIATLKHFAAYDASTGGRDSSEMDISERALREIWLPPFHAAVNAGAGSIMCAYHAINGIPAAANQMLLTDILKKEWGFDGFVVTDFMCVDSLFNGSHVVSTLDEAIKTAFEAGIDVRDHDLGEYDFAKKLAELVRKGYISERTLNEATRRVLRAKFRLGLFDNPFVDPKAASQIVGTAANRRVALNVARESLVLLKNQNNLLPLKKDIKSIAVIGPNADSLGNQLGVWCKEVVPERAASVVTILQGIKNQLPGTKINYAKGCDITSSFKSVLGDDSHPVISPDKQVGFKAEYFNNPSLSGEPALVRIDKAIDFNWVKEAPAPGINADNFSIRWTGIFSRPTGGRYRFGVTCDNAVRVYMDGKLIIDAWQSHVGTDLATVYLEADREYQITLEYREDEVDANIKFGIEGPTETDKSIMEAVEAAKASEVAVVVVGDDPTINGETRDRANLDLTGLQNALVQAVLRTGTPTVVVLVNARPLTINEIAADAPAILEAWNPGEQGGNAVAEALFGEYNPGGKLPITFPASVGQIPITYDFEPGWHGGSYACNTPSKPLYSFGYGLSYTTFSYSNLKLSSQKIKASDKVTVSVDVENTGGVAGDEVVQLYIHDLVASRVQPNKRLKGFSRINLKPGEKKTVSFDLASDDLAFYNVKMQRVVEPGMFDIMVGGDSDKLINTSLVVIK